MPYGANKSRNRCEVSLTTKVHLALLFRVLDCGSPSVSLASVSLAVTRILLVVFNNQPLRNFKSNITLNALVSAAGQISLSALLVPVASTLSQLKWVWCQKRFTAIKEIEDFDRASRGPVGIVRLILRKLTL